jgi:carbamoylphosphate synthase small subunit
MYLGNDVGGNQPFATLVLEDGTVLPGQPFGAAADAVFELVFNTRA